MRMWGWWFVEVSSSPVPQADQGWREGTVERWVTFWGSPLSRQVEPSDEGAFRRLFRLYDEIDRMWDAVEETGRVVAGSQGQPRPNPLLKQIQEFGAEARQLEDRFGSVADVSVAVGYHVCGRSGVAGWVELEVGCEAG
jgi:hypothetical protein